MDNLKSISIRVASPEEIYSWSHGEVVKPETLNYRTQRPEKDGLFSERIFGPTKDYECYCGKYKKIRYKGIVCEKCGVEVTRAIVRRERMGHITLAAPVIHIWYLKTVPSKLSLILNISVPKLEKVVYYASYIVTAVNETNRQTALKNLEKEFETLKSEKAGQLKDLKESRERISEILTNITPGLIISEAEYFTLSERFGDVFEADRGAAAIRKILEHIDLQALEKQIEEELKVVRDVTREKRLLLRLKVVRSLLASNIKPEWLVMTVLPVLPPDLRPMVPLDGGRFATADLNDLYRRIINRNNRLKKLMELHSPEVIVVNEKRMLQEAVDALIDNSVRMGVQLLSNRRRPLRSLSDMLKGKQGRFRQNLLGKRVDYSARSVIVVGPELGLHECGLPKSLALELFRPFVINKLIDRGIVYNIKQANRIIESAPPEVWEILEEVIENKKVLLNRAPTLHRLGIQAFKPLLTEGLAIRIPPLVCAAFNADFDGDQMAVHLPLTEEAQAEAHQLMDARYNVLKPSSGDPISNPVLEIVLGCYFLTSEKPGAKGEGRAFSSFSEAMLAFENGFIDINSLIKVHHKNQLLTTTYGRLIFNNVLPEGFEYVNTQLNKASLSQLVSRITEHLGVQEVYRYLDKIKALGYEYATHSAATWSINDTISPIEKKKIIEEGEREVELIESQYNDGLLTDKERREKVVHVWISVKDKVAALVPKSLDSWNPVFMIINSKSRGSWSQANQMMGMRGLLSNPRGEVIELPIRSSYKDGLSVIEYFISTHGARKGSTDTALKTASAGYLTRRLVDVSQDLVVKEEDCKTKEGIEILRKEGEEYGYNFADRLYSRSALSDIKVSGKIVAKAGEIITREMAREIASDTSIESVVLRSPITCKTLYGVCVKCYGLDLTKKLPIALGEAVGVIAAQSIGEPGTQLTMRTFHVGGVAGVDITHGLPRVEEIFESRPPKGKAVLSKYDGTITNIEDKGLTKVISITHHNVKKKSGKSASTVQEYVVPGGVTLKVKLDDEVKRGDALTEGPLDIKEVLAYRGVEAVKRYIINEIQKIYVPEGASISDKHIEIIVRQMLSRVIVKDTGDTDFMRGEMVDKSKFIEINRRVKSEGKTPAKAVQSVIGITRVALTTESFLSAASFQETSRVLVNAAIEGKTDRLRGLKENVIIGKLIPVGSGRLDGFQRTEVDGSVDEGHSFNDESKTPSTEEAQKNS